MTLSPTDELQNTDIVSKGRTSEMDYYHTFAAICCLLAVLNVYGTEAAVGTNCTVAGDADCASGNHEVCDPDGTDLCVCDDSLGYADNSGTCELKDCGSLTAPSHGSVDTSAGTNVGDQASFSCDTGYTPVAAATSDCQAAGTWSTPSHTCTIVDCTTPTDPGNGAIVLAGGAAATKYQDTGTVTCDAGFGLSTNEASTTITCQAAGSWTTIPTCSVGAAADCGDPTEPTNGAISTAPSATTEGHEATVGCDSGYTLDGTPTITCQHDTSWSAAGTCDSDDDGNGAESVTAGLIFTLAYTVTSRLF